MGVQVVNEEAHGGVLVQAPVAAAQDSRPTFCLATCLPDAPLPAKVRVDYSTGSVRR